VCLYNFFYSVTRLMMSVSKQWHHEQVSVGRVADYGALLSSETLSPWR
jgi:hypothetical protein